MKEDLKRYKEMKIELETIEDKLEYLKEKKTSIKSQIITDLPVSTQSELDRLNALLVEMEKVIKLYMKKQRKILKKMYKIEKSLDILEPLEKTVIRYAYFDNKRFEEISCKIKL